MLRFLIGYNMARNLQAKLPSTDVLRVYDINIESVEKFKKDTAALTTGAQVQGAANAREAVEDSVSPSLCLFPQYSPSHTFM
jgi:hypothetical protein